jgi:hypothetical protein
MTYKYAFILPGGKKEFKHIQNALMKCGFIWVGRENDRSYRMEYEWFQSGGTYMYFESLDIMNVRQSNFSSISQIEYSLKCSNYRIVSIDSRTFDECTTKGMVFERLEFLYKAAGEKKVVGLSELYPKKPVRYQYNSDKNRPARECVDDKSEVATTAISMPSPKMLTVRASIKSDKAITFNNSLLTIKTKS